MDFKNLTVNERVRFARKLKDLTQTDVALFLGIKTSTYSQKERKGYFSASDIARLSEFLSIKSDFFLFGQMQPKPEADFIIKYEPDERFSFLENAGKKDLNFLKLIMLLSPKKRTAVYKYAYDIFNGKIQLSEDKSSAKELPTISAE